jgi:hypothetical protein
MSRTRLDKTIILKLAKGDKEGAIQSANAFGWLERNERGLVRVEERIELEEKLPLLGFDIPWAE